jgi:hypothetical protein
VGADRKARIVLRLALALAGGVALGAGALGAGGLGGQASAAAVPAPAQFGFAVAAVGTARTYFTEHLRPGASTRLTLRVSSTVSRPERLDVAPVVGATDTNTGDGYAWSGPCATPTPTCWISGLPSSVVLLPGTSLLLHARLDVPASATPGQYLLGVGVRSRPGSPSTIGGHGDASAVLRVVQEVNVGVAVTIGTPDQLHPALHVTGVAERRGGGAVVASVGLVDTGDTFVHSSGTLVVDTSTGPLKEQLAPGTMLPRGRAAVDVGLGRLATGSYPVAVFVRYGGDAGPLDRRVAWRGDLVVGESANRFGVPPPAPSVLRTAVHDVPVWLWGLLGGLVGIVGVLLATRVAAWRQPGRHVRSARRRRPEHSPRGRSVPVRPLPGAALPDRRVAPPVSHGAQATWITHVPDDGWPVLGVPGEGVPEAGVPDDGWPVRVPVGAGRHRAGAHAARRKDPPEVAPEVPVG